MASDDDIIRVIAKFEGEEEGKRLAAATELAEQKFKALYASLGAGDGATKAAAASLSDLNAKMQAAGGSSKQTGQLLMQAGYAADDLQYGFKGIANNIQPILQSIPGLGAMAPFLSIAAIAAYQLWEHSAQIADVFGLGRTKTQAEEMEELGKKTEKTAAETAKLLKYEELRAAVKAQSEGKTAAQTKLAKGVREAIQEGPYGEIARGVDTHFGKEIQAQAELDPAFLQAQADLKAAKLKAPFDKQHGAADLKEAQEAYDALRGEARGKFLGGAETDPARARALERAARAHPGDFGPGAREFADTMKEAQKTPKEIREKKEAAEDAAAEEHFREQQEENARKQQEWSDKATAEADDEAIKAEDSGRANDKFIKQNRAGRDAKLAEQDDLAIKAEDDARANDKFLKKNRIEQGEKATRGTALDERAGDAFMRNALRSGGDGKKAQEQLEEQLRREYKARGLGDDAAGTAARAKAKEVAGKTAEGINDDARNPKVQKAPERTGVADFARSVESAGQADAKKLLTTTEGIKERLTDLVRMGQQGARAGP